MSDQPTHVPLCNTCEHRVIDHVDGHGCTVRLDDRSECECGASWPDRKPASPAERAGTPGDSQLEAEHLRKELRACADHGAAALTKCLDAWSAQVTEARSRIAELEKELDGWREREAAVCPEDLGFEEVIAYLRAANAGLASDLLDVEREANLSHALAVKEIEALRADRRALIEKNAGYTSGSWWAAGAVERFDTATEALAAFHAKPSPAVSSPKSEATDGSVS